MSHTNEILAREWDGSRWGRRGFRAWNETSLCSVWSLQCDHIRDFHRHACPRVLPAGDVYLLRASWKYLARPVLHEKFAAVTVSGLLLPGWCRCISHGSKERNPTFDFTNNLSLNHYLFGVITITYINRSTYDRNSSVCSQMSSVELCCIKCFWLFFFSPFNCINFKHRIIE